MSDSRSHPRGRYGPDLLMAAGVVVVIVSGLLRLTLLQTPLMLLPAAAGCGLALVALMWDLNR